MTAQTFSPSTGSGTPTTAALEAKITRLEQGEEHGLVHLAAAVGLHIGKAATEQLLGAFDGDRLDLVDIFAAAIIAAARIAFGVLVGQDRTTGFEHGT